MGASWSFQTAGQLVFGPGSVGRLGELAGGRSWRKLLIVTDANLQNLGLVDHVAAPLREAGLSVEVFSGGKAEPSLEIADQAIAAAQDFAPQAIVGLGGGSNMDLAKITAAIHAHGGQPGDYFGFDRLPGPVTPLLCIPTTSGTGSEVSHAAVLTDTANAMKVSTLSPHLRPALAVVDPELTYGCPKQVAADSGIDALTHAIEAYTATEYPFLNNSEEDACAYEGSHPLGDCLAERAISLIGRHLSTAVNQPEDHSARDQMALAATLAGIAFSNCGVALVHALEYPVGGAVHCSHGAGNGLLLPYVMRFNLPVREAKFARVAELLGENVAGKSQAEAAEAAVTAVEKMKRDIGIPERLRELGAKPEQLPEFAAKSFAIDRLRRVNPRSSTEQDLLGILQEAF